MAAEKLSPTKKRKAVEVMDESRAKHIKTSHSSTSLSTDNVLVAGKIQRVFMKNFMCHEKMEVNLNPQINYIVGANGSGKSAILTALVVGLGARATATDRGPSIKEFIKTGKSSASIEITISNEGPKAYKYENYGNAITVIRNISTSSSTYKIKNWRGEVVSTKKEELENIINFLNIQVDNPISVLNQDVSRSFLVAAGSAQKYKLFMKATRLDIIGENYKEAMIVSQSSRQQLTETEKYLKLHEKEINQLRKKFEALESLNGLRQESEDLSNELRWATVIQEEEKLLHIESKIQKEQQNMDKLKNLEHNKASKEQEIDTKISDLKKEIAQAEADASESNLKLNDLKESYTIAKKLHNERREKTRDLHASIKRKKDDIIALQNEIEMWKRESSEASDRKQSAIQAIAQYESQLDEVEATLRTKQTDLMHLEENKRRIEQEEHKAKIDLEQKRITFDKLKQRLTAFQNQSNDALTVYGSNMPRLLRRIEEAYRRGRFRQKPVGPLGSFIKLKDSSWIPAIENHLGFGTLTSFCVDNSQDGRVLDIIMKEEFRNERPPQVVISKFFDRMHDVREGCANSPRYSNLLDALEISHPVIANSLIDQREIECILLIPTSDEACAIMSDANKVPRNCKRAITKQADLFYPDPNYRTYGGSVSRQKFLQVSTSEAIQSLKEEISVVEDELRIAQHNYNHVCQKMRTNKLELRTIQEQVKKLIHQQQQLKSNIDESKESIETHSNNAINTFMTEIEELEKLVVEEKKRENHEISELRQTQKNVEVIGNELNKYRDLAQNLDARLNPIKEKIKELKDERNRLNISNQGAARRMEELKQILQKLNGEHQQQQRVVNSKVEIAENVCPRINTTKNINNINSRLKELKVIIESAEKQLGSKDEIYKDLQEKEQKYAGLQEFAVALIRSNNKHLIRLKKREDFYRHMKRLISERVQSSFSNVLSLRNYKGSIRIDHQKGELHLEVSPTNDDKRPTNDAKALSGGERSYSTVAFILALWDATELPFYFLDEFDVFMDKINRRVIMDILLGYANANPQSQFSFLTPLDTSHIMANNSITIHRLAAPERSV